MFKNKALTHSLAIFKSLKLFIVVAQTKYVHWPLPRY